MRTGTLHNRVTIQQLVTGAPQQTAIGETDAAWTTYATCYAQIQPLLGREFMAAQQVQSKVDTKIRVRYMAAVTDGITAAMRVNDGGKIYNIEAAINVENRNREWLLMCSTIGANQV